MVGHWLVVVCELSSRVGKDAGLGRGEGMRAIQHMHLLLYLHKKSFGSPHGVHGKTGASCLGCVFEALIRSHMPIADKHWSWAGVAQLRWWDGG